MKRVLGIIFLLTICFSMWGEDLFKDYSNGKYGFVDKNGYMKIPFLYDYVSENSTEGIIMVKKNGKSGYIDETGKIVIPLQYEWAHDFCEGIARVKKDGKWGYIDKNGKVVIPLQYSDAGDFSEGLAMVKQNGKAGYIDKAGKVVIPLQYDWGSLFCSGVAFVKLNEELRVINKAGETTAILGEKYMPYSRFSEGVAAVQKKNGKSGYIDKTGKVIIPFQYKYNSVKNFSEGLASIRGNAKNDKRGYINKNGEVVIPFLYDSTRDFCEGIAAVEKDGKWGYIDKNGKVVIPLQYDEISNFSEGLAWAKRHSEWGWSKRKYIDIQNNVYNTKEEGLLAVSKNAIPQEPPLLNIIPNSICFTDATGDNTIGAEESCKITFQVSNTGKGAGKKCIAKVTTTATGIGLADQPLPTIPAGESITVEIPITTSMNTVTGQADFYISIEEPHGFGCDPITLAVATKAFEAPLLKITDYAVSGTNNGQITKRTPFELQLLLQNIEYGDAEDVAVEVSFPQDVLVVDGTKNRLFASLKGGEKRTLNYTLITNNNYAQASIPVAIKITEKYGRYAESGTINLPIGKPIANTRIVIDATNTTPKKGISVAQIEGKVKPSDVDVNIPQSTTTNEKTFAVIVANEQYDRESNVEFAENDGAIFRQYCIQTLGLPENNVHYLPNATLNALRYEVDWLTKVAKAYQGKAQLIFYYAGHGVPDEKSKSAYLLPVDGMGSNSKSGYMLSELYEQLGAAPSTSTLVFLDACFSGAQRSGDMMASARAIAIEAKPESPKGGNIVIFSAAQGIETAYPYRSKNHGMFTYFLLKKLQESQGNATLGEIVKYVTDNVSRHSIVDNMKSQTPTVTPSPALLSSWQKIKMK